MRHLSVTEAARKDAGRGIARIDPHDLRALGCEVGDVVLVSAAGRSRGQGRATAVRVLPALPEDRGGKAIRIDGVIRENAGVGIGERVALRRTSALPARAVILEPRSSSAVALAKGETGNLGELLAGLPVVAGDRLRVPLLGGGLADFSVKETTPEGVVLMAREADVTFHGADVPKGARSGVTYEDIGGLTTELGRIRELIELPLKFPEVFERLGIEAPKGVLLTGPPGTGKTLIARAVAHETEATFLHLSGPEIMNKFYGESEARLREVFAEAEAAAPSIVFLDEIDAIAPKREDLSGEKQVERRIVAQLLAVLDGLRERGRVIVIGATNIPNALDPALRRPGRFDREITLPIPAAPSRREILEIHTRGMPLAEDVNLERLAAITHGFVGADLAALAREAAMRALRDALPEAEWTNAALPPQRLQELRVGMGHFREALKEVEPSALREVFTEVPTVTWGDVGGLPEAKRTLREAVEWPLQHADLFAAVRLRPPKGILLTGPPGTGKTLLAKAVAHEAGVNFIAIAGPALLSRYLGESERGVREVFRKARQAAPCIIFFDEIDSLVLRRGLGGETGMSERVVGQFLTEMDGIEALKGVVVLGATNRAELLDPALLRAGRFEVIIALPLPDQASREEILAVHTRGQPLGADVHLKELAALCDGANGADIEAICRSAALEAVRERLASRRPGQQSTAASRLVLTATHFAAALRTRQRDLPGAPAPSTLQPVHGRAPTVERTHSSSHPRRRGA